METEDQHHGQEVEQDTMDQLIRASSLGPEREQLKFQVPTLVGAPNEVSELVQHIQHVAEQFLYHWKTFPIGRPHREPLWHANGYTKSGIPVN